VADIIDLREGDEVHSGILYRWIYPHSHYYKAKDNPPRPSSVVFLPDGGTDPSVSMFRAAETTPSEVLEGHEGYGLLEIDAEKLWALGKRVTYEPKHGKGHVGVRTFSKRDDQPRRDAAFASRVIVPPTLPAN
jgi:hypothetical protein